MVNLCAEKWQMYLQGRLRLLRADRVFLHLLRAPVGCHGFVFVWVWLFALKNKITILKCRQGKKENSQRENNVLYLQTENYLLSVLHNRAVRNDKSCAKTN